MFFDFNKSLNYKKFVSIFFIEKPFPAVKKSFVMIDGKIILHYLLTNLNYVEIFCKIKYKNLY